MQTLLEPGVVRRSAGFASLDVWHEGPRACSFLAAPWAESAAPLGLVPNGAFEAAKVSTDFQQLLV